MVHTPWRVFFVSTIGAPTLPLHHATALPCAPAPLRSGHVHLRPVAGLPAHSGPAMPRRESLALPFIAPLCPVLPPRRAQPCRTVLSFAGLSWNNSGQLLIPYTIISRLFSRLPRLDPLYLETRGTPALDLRGSLAHSKVGNICLLRFGAVRVAVQKAPPQVDAQTLKSRKKVYNTCFFALKKLLLLGRVRPVDEGGVFFLGLRGEVPV